MDHVTMKKTYSVKLVVKLKNRKLPLRFKVLTEKINKTVVV